MCTCVCLFSQTDSLAERKQSFQRGCMYWVHPNIPWMKLFPRIADEAKSRYTALNCAPLCRLLALH
ncbi:hypothetical protein DPMN_042369 [Dreissena polymorpha]|uniref:Uncharacterized protein n=1 Tax=Dreissena polymorpha TaxID=45954 RepID=A0A9D4CYH7_DREPO|nr:hypothetical protein DPMN_042369 [Dreissena polymorpha]